MTDPAPDPDRRPPEERDLQIHQDLPFQRIEAHLQHATWAAMLLTVAAGLAGLLGSGPLSDAVAGQPGSALWIQHQRFAHWGAPTPLHIHLGPRGPTPFATLWVLRDFGGAHDIDRVTPPPLTVELHADRLQYVFHAPDPTAEVTVTFQVRASRWGRNAATIGVPGGPEVHFRQIVFP